MKTGHDGKNISNKLNFRQCRLNFFSVIINCLSRKPLRKKKTCPTESPKSLKINEMKTRCIIFLVWFEWLNTLCFGWLSEGQYLIMTQQFSPQSPSQRAHCSLGGSSGVRRLAHCDVNANETYVWDRTYFMDFLGKIGQAQLPPQPSHNTMDGEYAFWHRQVH